MSLIKRLSLRSVGGLVLALFMTSAVLGQAERDLDIGALHFYTNEAMSADDVQYPAGQPYTDQRMLETYGVIIGVKRQWTDPNGVQWDYQVAQVTDNKFSDIENVTPPVEGGFKRTFRNPYPDLIADGVNWTGTFAQQDPVDPSIPADAQIEHHLNTWSGIDIQRWTYAFGNQEEDDYMVVEYRFKNTSEEPREDVYFGITGATNSHAFYPADFWGNYYGATYGSDAPDADTMRVWYSWDANEISGEPTVDDRGSPESLYGHFTESQSMFHMVLHADGEAHDPGVAVADDPNQPHKAGWSYRELSPDLNIAGPTTVYNFLKNGWSDQIPGKAYSTVVNKQGQEQPWGSDGAKYRQLKEGIDINDIEPATEQSKTSLFSFGPYNMAPGEEVRIVTAVGGGQIPHRLAIDAGRAYKNGNEAQRFDQPLPEGRNLNDSWGNQIVRDGDIYNQDGELIAEAGQMLDRNQKDQVLDMSITDAFMRASHVKQIWEQSDVLEGQGSFAVDLAPASPSLKVTSENKQIRLEWGNEAQQDTRAGNVEKYRIYRNYWRPPSLDVPTDTTHVLLAEVDADEPHEYIDKEVIVGEQYWYYVTAVTEDGVESSAYQNRMGRSARPDVEAAVPTRAPSQNWQEEVVVTPNPYHARAANKYGGRRVNFLNLPAYAKIHIYTMKGDLVQTLDHTSNTGDEEWRRQETFSTMEIVSGVYLYVVEELDSPNGSPTGEKTIGKFVVIK